MEGRGLHNNSLSEGTSAVLRGGGTDENEIGENSRQGNCECCYEEPYAEKPHVRICEGLAS